MNKFIIKTGIYRWAVDADRIVTYGCTGDGILISIDEIDNSTLLESENGRRLDIDEIEEVNQIIENLVFGNSSGEDAVIDIS